MDKQLLKYLFAWTPIVFVVVALLYSIIFVNPQVGIVMICTFFGILFLVWFFWGVWHVSTGRKGK